MKEEGRPRIGRVALSIAAATALMGFVGLLANPAGAGSPGSPDAVPLAGSSWTIQKVAEPAGALATSLSGVSCPGPSACTAVGYYESRTSTDVPLVEVWNGASWAVQSAPIQKYYGVLSSVSCTAVNLCMAVGIHDNSESATLPLAYSWNGVAWSADAVPTPKGGSSADLTSVFCGASGGCTAVGSYYTSSSYTATLVEVWNGSSWRVQQSPTPTNFGESGGQLSSVSCSSLSACVATGYSGVLNNAFSEVRTGSTWKIETIPNPAALGASELYGTSCVAGGPCTTVGYFLNTSYDKVTLVEVWDGSSWTIEPSPNVPNQVTNELLAVSCTSAKACSAVGNDGSGSLATLAEVWNGIQWSTQRIPNLGPNLGQLPAVSCASSSTCMAVGSDVGPVATSEYK